MSARALLALVLALTAPVHAAERCTRYVPITSPCAGIGGPRSRIVAGRAAVPALATCRAGLDAERELRTVDARAAVAQLALLERQLAARPLRLPAALAPTRAPPTSPIVWVVIGFAGGVLACGVVAWRAAQ